MSQYLALALALTFFQVVKTTQAFLAYKLYKPSHDTYVKTRVLVTLTVAGSLFWAPGIQLILAYVLLVYYALSIIERVLAALRPRSFFGQLLAAKRAGKEMYLEIINDENRRIANDQSLDGCC